ncbi:ethylbenzene dehydrogenase [Sulfuracidifex metallicus]|uniref:ethylbenzene dehydrogenase n=1 Tax=Sulfuracidifex metallicus TaxID=47303 RepID=UPI002275E6B0|nr:ethylbenzene dehydrogenase [Sulfuracidifex metallicus]MCY0849860.1 ethylbenzene dehydrogenase [Sulfuracidifex metallicus]
MANGYTKLLLVGAIVVIAILLASYGADFVLNSAAQATSTVTAYYVPNASPDLGNPGSESFWSAIPWTSVPLVPTVPVPGGIAGHTHFVYVKAAWTYVDNVPYIMVLMKARNHGYISWMACPETTTTGKLWQPFSVEHAGWWVVNVSYRQTNESVASINCIPVKDQIQYPPGEALANPIQIIAVNQSGKLVGEILGATGPGGHPLNGGNPIVITSLDLNYSGHMITSMSQFVKMGLNDTTWGQNAYNEFYPEDTAKYVTLFYNSSFMYPERFAILWSLGGAPSDWYQIAYTPHMMPGTSGAISAGQDELWVLSDNPRANNTQDFGYPGLTLFSRNSTPPYAHYAAYKDPLNLGYLKNQGIIADAYVNGSSIYYIGGVPFIGFPNLNTPQYNTWDLMNGMYNASKLWNPSVVATGITYHQTQTGTYWYAEFVRTFSTVGVSGGQGESHYQVQLSPGKTYHVAFAVFQGGAGESVDFKSISFWYNLYIEPASSSSYVAMLPLLMGLLIAPMVPLSMKTLKYPLLRLLALPFLKTILKVLGHGKTKI